MSYRYYVSEDLGVERDPNLKRFKQSDFDNAADAMALFSAAVAEGTTEYITIEALLDR